MYHFITISTPDPYTPATVMPCNTEAEIDEAAAYLADKEIASAPIWSGDPEGDSVKTHLVVLAEEREDDGWRYIVAFTGRHKGLSPWSTGHGSIAEAESSAEDARCRGLEVEVVIEGPLEQARYEVRQWAEQPGHAPLASQARERLAQLGLDITLAGAAKALGFNLED